MNQITMFAEPLLLPIMAKLPSILIALAVFFIGWAVAKGLGKLTGKLVHKLTDSARAKGLVEIKDEYQMDRAVGKAVYYFLMLFVLVLCLDILGVSAVMAPFMAMAGEFTAAVPNLVKAGLIFLVAWLLATVLRGITVRVVSTEAAGSAMTRTGIIESQDAHQRVVSGAGNLAYYLVLLVFLPAILGALDLQGLQGPFELMLSTILAYLPNLFAAAVTLLIGYVVARIVRGIVTHFSASAGADRLPEKVGMAQVFKTTPLSRMLGTITFVLILLPVAISALETLGIAAISDPAISMLTIVLNMVPNAAMAVLLMIAGIALARWVGQLVSGLLESLNFPRMLTKWGLLQGEKAESAVPATIGSVTTGLIILLITIEAFEILHLSVLSNIFRDLLAYLPNVLVAVVILAAGWAVGQFADRSLRSVLANSAYPLWLGSVARFALFTLAGMMALEQLGVAPSIVVNGFTILLGSMGLAAAIAVGLGAREAVQRWIDRQVK